MNKTDQAGTTERHGVPETVVGRASGMVSKANTVSITETASLCVTRDHSRQ